MVKLIAGLLAAAVCLGCQENKKTAALPDYKQMGDSIASASFDVLRTALQASIAGRGAEASIGFCRDTAQDLMQTYASESVYVGRVAERYRNPANALKQVDGNVWADYREAISKGDSIFSRIVVTDTAVHYYKPILLQPMCLTCHGEPGKDIPPKLLAVIDSSYPGDLARGFRTGDLRGMWYIRFDR